MQLQLLPHREPRCTALFIVFISHAWILYLLVSHLDRAPRAAAIGVRNLDVAWLAAPGKAGNDTGETGGAEMHAGSAAPRATRAAKNSRAPTVPKRTRDPIASTARNSAPARPAPDAGMISGAHTAAQTRPSTASAAAAAQPRTGASDEKNAETGAAQKNATLAPSFEAEYLHNPAPLYPSLSRELGEQGRVLLRVLVAADGGVLKIELHHGSGFDRLDRAATHAVSSWRFIPAKSDGRSVSAWVIVPIVFSLRE